MSTFKQLYTTALEDVAWCALGDIATLSDVHSHWLQTPGSLTKRLQCHCTELSVSLIGVNPLTCADLSDSERELLGDVDCLSREVVLFGDGVPWVYARTLLPMSTLTEQEQDLAQLEIPLGARLFNDDTIERDALQAAKVEQDDTWRWARRSRLWVNDKPLLVAELFLDAAPIYAKEQIHWR